MLCLIHPNNTVNEKYDQFEITKLLDFIIEQKPEMPIGANIAFVIRVE